LKSLSARIGHLHLSHTSQSGQIDREFYVDVEKTHVTQFWTSTLHGPWVRHDPAKVHDGALSIKNFVLYKVQLIISLHFNWSTIKKALPTSVNYLFIFYEYSFSMDSEYPNPELLARVKNFNHDITNDSFRIVWYLKYISLLNLNSIYHNIFKIYIFPVFIYLTFSILAIYLKYMSSQILSFFGISNSWKYITMSWLHAKIFVEFI
jgi:hypothetical protein